MTNTQNIQDEKLRAQHREQMTAAARLLNRRVRFAHQPEGPYYKVVRVSSIGMIELSGMDAEFAPHLFVVEGRVH
jgi:hypothetical protein